MFNRKTSHSYLEDFYPRAKRDCLRNRTVGTVHRTSNTTLYRIFPARLLLLDSSPTKLFIDADNFN